MTLPPPQDRELRCGCTDGIVVGHWKICPRHEHDRKFVNGLEVHRLGLWMHSFEPEPNMRRHYDGVMAFRSNKDSHQ